MSKRSKKQNKDLDLSVLRSMQGDDADDSKSGRTSEAAELAEGVKKQQADLMSAKPKEEKSAETEQKSRKDKKAEQRKAREAAAQEKAAAKAKTAKTDAKDSNGKMQKSPQEKNRGGSAPEKLKVGLAIVLIIVGTILCTYSVSILSKRSTASSAEVDALAALQKDVTELKTEDAGLPNITDAVIRSVTADTNVNSAVQSFIQKQAENTGVVVHKLTTFEKRNEYGSVKAFYRLEGVSQTKNIVELLKSLQGYERVLLVDEVYLSEGTKVSVGLEVVNDQSTVVKEFRIVLQDAFSRDQVTENSAVPTAGPSVKAQDVSVVDTTAEAKHVHEFGDQGWSKIPTHEVDGEQIRVCATCNTVETIRVSHGDQYHSWSNGDCGSRVCTTCNAKEDPYNPVHFMGLWKTISEPTCYMKGYAERKCINPECDEVEIRDLPMVEHKWIEQSGKTVCAVCGTIKPEGISIAIGE